MPDWGHLRSVGSIKSMSMNVLLPDAADPIVLHGSLVTSRQPSDIPPFNRELRKLIGKNLHQW